MRKLLSIFFVFPFVSLHADDDAILAEVRSADDARVAAMIAADGSALDSILSDALYYGHSGDGTVENKSQRIDSLVTRRGIYRKFDFKEREFSVIAPGAVLCKGRAVVEVGNPHRMYLVDINFIAVWRLEDRRWKLFAWQSSRNAQPVLLVSSHNEQPNQSLDPTPIAVTPAASAPVAPATGVGHL